MRFLRRPTNARRDEKLLLLQTRQYLSGVFISRLRCSSPFVAYNARAKAKPNTLIHQPHWRIRTDTVDVRGHVTLRYLGRLRHLNVGWKYCGHAIRLYVLDGVVTFATEDGEFIGETRIDPNRAYQPKGDDFR